MGAQSHPTQIFKRAFFHEMPQDPKDESASLFLCHSDILPIALTSSDSTTSPRQGDHIHILTSSQSLQPTLSYDVIALNQLSSATKIHLPLFPIRSKEKMISNILEKIKSRFLGLIYPAATYSLLECEHGTG